MKTKTITIYSIDELPEDVRERVLDQYRTINIDYTDCLDHVVDDIKSALKLLGFHVDRVFYQVSYGQGDGFCFDGTYSYAPGATKAVREQFPTEIDLHRAADRLQRLQMSHFYGLSAVIRGHEPWYAVDCDVDSAYTYLRGAKYREVVKEMIGIVEDLCRWAYYLLRSEMENLTSDEAVMETLRINGFEFTADGRTV